MEPCRPWDKPFIVPDGMNIADAIRGMVADRFPDVEFRAVDAPPIWGNLRFETRRGSDPWRDMTELAQAYGLRLTYTDGRVELSNDQSSKPER